MQKAWELAVPDKDRILLGVSRHMPTWMPWSQTYHQYIARRKATIIARQYLPEIQSALEKLDSETLWELRNYLTRLYIGLAQEGLAVPEYFDVKFLNEQLWKNLQRSYLNFVRNVATSSLPPMSLEEFAREVRKREREYVERPVVQAIGEDLQRWGRAGG